jgi:hypothetical protein
LKLCIPEGPNSSIHTPHGKHRAPVRKQAQGGQKRGKLPLHPTKAGMPESCVTVLCHCHRHRKKPYFDHVFLPGKGSAPSRPVPRQDVHSLPGAPALLMPC